MKLLFCDKCSDMFKLGRKLKQCECGHCKGMYTDEIEAVVNGNGYSVAIGNGSFINAIRVMEEMSSDPGSNLHGRNDWLIDASIEYAWVRPHDGPGNPHTTVDPNLGEEDE